VGISSDFPWVNKEWSKKMGLSFPLLSDWDFKEGKTRKTLEAYGILDTNPDSLVYRYSKRAYIIIDKDGIVRYQKILDNPRELVENAELLAELDKINKM
jgi:peroxiredoxin